MRTILIRGVNEVESFETFEEGLAAALSSEPGSIITIHSPQCHMGMHEDGSDESKECDCVPVELVAGAKA